jgi:hypothetical protein
MVEVDQACWGGVPRTFKDLSSPSCTPTASTTATTTASTSAFKNDMFGWEFIDQGISTELLWQTYVQMREFAEQTDSTATT